ncbi:CCA tRNA nucleotidyltransferase [bacterium]|nr:CCA tRNA nucleotidyltransferase [bacterium]
MLKKYENSPGFSILRQLGQIADERQLPLYAVGGFVRDLLLNKQVKDIDFTVLGDAVDFAKHCSRELRISRPVVFERFGTAMIEHQDFHLEFVSARAESYSEHSRKPDVVPGSLLDDLKRRDFTVNTLALGLNQENFGELIDELHGRKDMKAKLLRTPLEPEQTFSDDPLRIMRALRFAAQLEFSIEPQTLEAVAKMAPRLEIVSQERITDEFMKLLSAKTPSTGLRLMYVTGVLEIVFPEVCALAGVEQIGPHHHKDVFEHTLQVVDQIAKLTDDPELRFAALVHDIAKPKTKRFSGDQGWTFHGHEDLGSRMLKTISRKLRLSEKTAKKVTKLVALHMRPINLTREDVTDSGVRRLIVDAGEDLEALMTLCRADITSANPKKVKRYLAQFEELLERISEVNEKDRLRAFQSPVRGEEIMEVCNIQPGPLVGKIKTALEDAILEGRIPNEHDAVLGYLHEIKHQYL